LLGLGTAIMEPLPTLARTDGKHRRAGAGQRENANDLPLRIATNDGLR
jgi:hypothetical protein